MEKREEALIPYFSRSDVRESLIRLTDSSHEGDTADNAGGDGVTFIVKTCIRRAGCNSRTLNKAGYAIHNAC